MECKFWCKLPVDFVAGFACKQTKCWMKMTMMAEEDDSDSESQVAAVGDRHSGSDSMRNEIGWMKNKSVWIDSIENWVEKMVRAKQGIEIAHLKKMIEPMSALVAPSFHGDGNAADRAHG